jgi:hypothetical protein
MKTRRFIFFSIFFLTLSSGWQTNADEWINEKHKGYSLLYKKSDEIHKMEYLQFIEHGVQSVRAFFKEPFQKEFEVYIHPNRQSLDKQWQKDWNMPDFKSECWMVASGVALKLDAISPAKWDTEACEHSYSDKSKTQQFITHELFHVYHGQFNKSPDFSDVENIDWLVEGLATYASGQCDKERMEEVKNALTENEIPSSLDKFWTGKLKYGLSGSVVMFIDNHLGRTKLSELLKFNKKTEVLGALQITEEKLLKDWKDYILRKR